MKEKYDVAIIGGGIAGLITGLHLQKMRKKSIILEHGTQVGGNMSGVWRKGFYFDCGDQSTENCGILFPILDELGLYNPDEWNQMKFRWASKEFDVTFNDYDQIRDDFKKYFPDSSAELDTWFDFIKPICTTLHKVMKSGPFPFAVSGFKKWSSNAKMMINGSGMAKYAYELISTTANQKALKIFPNDPKLAYLFGEFGVNNMLLMMHIFFWYAFVNDYWYPKAGLQGFCNKLADAYRERGGEIMFKSTVDRVNTSGKIVTSIETSKGQSIKSYYVVNTGNPKRFINEMLDNPNNWDYKDRDITTYAKVSPAVCSACLGLNMNDKELEKYMKVHHTFYWRTYDSAHDDIYDPNVHLKGWSMINATSFHQPNLAPEGKSSLIVQAFTSYHWQNGWKTGSADPFERNQEYKKLKEKVLNDLIKSTEFIIPGLSKKIAYKELATPRSMARWTLNPEGSIMGWTYDLLKCHMAGKFVKFRTPFKNLYQAGQYSIWPGGVVFSAMSGRIVAKGIYSGFKRQLFI